MKNRNPIAVFALSFITLGIYSIYWDVSTKDEMNKQGADIPTAWLIIIPFVSIYWLYKYCKGIEHVTGGKMSTVLAFILLYILGPIGAAIIQVEFNKVSSSAAIPVAPAPTDGVYTPESPGTMMPELPISPQPPQVPPTPPEPPTNPIS